MNKQTNISRELLWDFAEGQCSAGDQIMIEEQLLLDAKLANDLMEIKVLSANLSNLEAEMPSMRFTKNVMDRLPAMNTLSPKEWSLSSRAKWFWGAAYLGLVGMAVYLTPAGTSSWLAQLKGSTFQLPHFSAINFNNWISISYVMTAAIIVLTILTVLKLEDSWRLTNKKS